MKKKKSIAAVSSFALFRTRFLRVLESHYQAEPIIARILKAESFREHCAALLWLTVSDARDRLARQSDVERTALNHRHDDAIHGFEAAEFLYRHLYNKPHLAEYLNSLRSELLLNRPAVDVAFASPKAYGRDRDWSIVRYAKEELEARLQVKIPNAVMADLLNAADIIAGRKFAGTKTQIHEADVDAGLRRLRERSFARILPFYRQLLSEHYPQGSNFPRSA